MTYLSQLRRERKYVPLTVESLDYFIHIDEALKHHMILHAFKSERRRTVILQRLHSDGSVKHVKGCTSMDSLENALKIVSAQFISRAARDQPCCNPEGFTTTGLLDLWIITGGKLRASSNDGKSVSIELLSADKNNIYVVRALDFEDAYHEAEDNLNDLYL